jgi:hypothetical protein
MRINLENQIDTINQKFSKIPLNKDLSMAIDKVKSFINTCNEFNSQKKDCLKDKNEMLKMNQQCEEEIKKLAELF